MEDDKADLSNSEQFEEEEIISGGESDESDSEEEEGEEEEEEGNIELEENPDFQTLMSENYTDVSDKNTTMIKEENHRSRATIDGLKLELSMWQKAYKDSQTKNAGRIQKLLKEYNKRENNNKEVFEQEKREIIEEYSQKKDNFKQEHEDVNLLFSTEHGNLDGILAKLNEQKLKWTPDFSFFGSKLINFLKSLETLQMTNELKEKEINSLRDSQYMKSQELNKIEIELREEINNKDRRIQNQKEELTISIKTISDIQTALKEEKDKNVDLERKNFHQDEEIFKLMTQISRLKKEKMDNDKFMNDNDENIRKKEKRIEILENRTRNLGSDIKKQLDEKETKIAFLNATIRKISEEKGKLDEIVVNLRNQITKERQRSLKKGKVQQSEVSVLQKQTHEKDREISKRERKVRNLERELESQKSLHSQAEIMIELQGKKIKKFEEENARLLELSEQIQRTMELEKTAQKKRDLHQETKIRKLEKKVEELQSKEKNELNKTASYLKKQIEENKDYEFQIKQNAEKKLQLYERRIDRILSEKERTEKQFRTELNELRSKNRKLKLENEKYGNEKEDLLQSNKNMSSVIEQQNNNNNNENNQQSNPRSIKIDEMKQELLSEISNLRQENLNLRDKQLELSEKLLNQTKRELDDSKDSFEQTRHHQQQQQQQPIGKSEYVKNIEKVLEDITKERDFYKLKTVEEGRSKEKAIDSLKEDLGLLQKKYRLVKDKYFRQSVRQNELQNCLLRMSKFSKMLRTGGNGKNTGRPGNFDDDVSVKRKKKGKKKDRSKVVRTLKIKKKKRGSNSGIKNRRRKSYGTGVNISSRSIMNSPVMGRRKSVRSVFSSGANRGSRSVPPIYRKSNY